MVLSSIVFGLNPIYSIGPCGAAILGVPDVTLMPVSGVLLCDSPTLQIRSGQRSPLRLTFLLPSSVSGC
jgi:hypothetical protein